MNLADVLAAHLTHRHNNGVDLWHFCTCGDGVRYYDRRKHAEHVAEAVAAAGLATVKLPEPDGLFDSPVSPLRICGLAMGGYGSYEDLSKDEAVVEIITPANIVSGKSIGWFNTAEGLRSLAAELLSIAEAVTT